MCTIESFHRVDWPRAVALALLAIALVSCRGQGQARFFSDQAYHFQTLRALNSIRADGADVGEVLETIKLVKEGDAQSWFAAWENTANRVLQRAEALSDPTSRGRAYFRAHNYLRTAEFFLPLDDAKRLPAFDRGAEVFYRGLDLLGVRYERIEAAFGSHHLNAVYYPGPTGAEEKPLIVLCGGFDSTLEELYFTLARAAHERGFSVLTYEGPGQGAVLRKQALGFTPEWEKPTGAVLDAFLATHPHPQRIVLVGMSLGGYLAPRAAAFDERFDGVVAYDVMYDVAAVAEHLTPGFVVWLLENGYETVTEALVGIKASLSPSFAWAVENGKWVTNSRTATQTLEAFRTYTLATTAARIKQDTLILVGAEDHFIPAQQAEDFARALTNARSVTTVVYDRASGGAEHCQLGAQSLWHADFFEWMEQKFPAPAMQG
jgi:alpha-beta hydrolase superfamily lysophospholipase